MAAFHFHSSISSSAFNLECSQSFAILFLPKFATTIAILERVLPLPLPPSNYRCPLTTADYEATAPPAPPPNTTTQLTPSAQPSYWHIVGPSQAPPPLGYFEAWLLHLLYSRPACSHRPSTTTLPRVLSGAFGFAVASATEAEGTPLKYRGELVVYGRW